MEHTFINEHSLVEERFDLKQYLFIIFKKRWILLSIVFVVMVLTSIYTFKQTPIYRATAILLIENTWNPPSFPTTRSSNIAPRLGGQDYYHTQYQILQSTMLAKRVCDALELPFSPSLLQKMITVH